MIEVESEAYIEGRDDKKHVSLPTLNMGNRISFRLYKNTRPHYLEIAPLQKGLVLIFDGKELIEEGVGFGVPVVKYQDKTYFSSSAQSSLREERNRSILIKSFNLDTISRKRLGRTSYVNDDFYSFFHKLFEKAYLSHKRLTPVFNVIMELRRALKVQTDFVKVAQRGKITVTYTCFPDAVEVEFDFSKLERAGCQEILVLNEQGSTFFTRYSDTFGLSLSDGSIGAWERVRAEWASLSDANQTLYFTLANTKAAPLFRGWERTKGRFSWAGLSYSLPPTVSTFNYAIRLRKEQTKICQFSKSVPGY
jgi:hypothetical protein